MDTEEKVGTDFEVVDSSCPAVLVRRDSGGGAVFVAGPGIPETEPRVRTGPEQGAGFAILIIKPGQTCMFLGRPSVRVFRSSS